MISSWAHVLSSLPRQRPGASDAEPASGQPRGRRMPSFFPAPLREAVPPHRKENQGGRAEKSPADA